MFDFYEELEKFKPVLEAEDVEEAVENDEAGDIAEIVKLLAKK